MSDEEIKKKKIHCNRCKLVTNHELRGEYASLEYLDEDHCDWEQEQAFLYSCAGCEAPTLVTEVNASYDLDPLVTFSPKRTASDRIVKRFHKLPSKLALIYSESINAYNSGSLLLCSIGLRTLLEGVCGDKGVKSPNLEKKIDNLSPLFASTNITRYLHGFRFVEMKQRMIYSL